MRLAVWNMAGRASGWEWLDRNDVEIALLNEVRPVAGRPGAWPSYAVHEGQQWRSAVITELPHAPVPPATPTYRSPKGTWPVFGPFLPKPGAVSAAIVTLPSDERLLAVAAYGVLSEFADTSMHRIICDLANILDDPTMPRLLVIGGDFNATSQWAGANRRFRARDATVLERLKGLDLVDAVDRFLPEARGPLEGCPCQEAACRHVHTRRDPRNPEVPWQNDYVFVSRSLAARLTSAIVVATNETFALSDHAPIVLDFR